MAPGHGAQCPPRARAGRTEWPFAVGVITPFKDSARTEIGIRRCIKRLRHASQPWMPMSKPTHQIRFHGRTPRWWNRDTTPAKGAPSGPVDEGQRRPSDANKGWTLCQGQQEVARRWTLSRAIAGGHHATAEAQHHRGRSQGSGAAESERRPSVAPCHEGIGTGFTPYCARSWSRSRHCQFKRGPATLFADRTPGTTAGYQKAGRAQESAAMLERS